MVESELREEMKNELDALIKMRDTVENRIKVLAFMLHYNTVVVPTDSLKNFPYKRILRREFKYVI